MKSYLQAALISFLIFILEIEGKQDLRLDPVARWTSLEYDINQGYLQNNYKYKNNILGNVRHFDGRMFLAVPRWRDGVPSTLNTIPIATSIKAQRQEWKLSPTLQPFPNLASNIIGDCSALQNVAALEIDPRGWLWVADSGTAAIFSSPSTPCKSKLLIYDLHTEMQLLHYKFPKEVVDGSGVLMHMVLDFSTLGQNGSTGRKTKLGSNEGDSLTQRTLAMGKGVQVYIADILHGFIVVFDFSSQSSWKVRSEQMKSLSLPLVIQGEEVQMRNGVTGVALESHSQPQTRRLFFGTLSSQLYGIETAILRNSSRDNDDVTDLVEEVVDRTDSCEAMTSDNGGKLYFGLLTKGSVATWNASEPDADPEILIQSPDKLVWINSIFFSDGLLWISTNRFHSFSWSSMTFEDDEPNFQIFKVSFQDDVLNYMEEFVNGANSICPNLLVAIVIALFTIVK